MILAHKLIDRIAKTHPDDAQSLRDSMKFDIGELDDLSGYVNMIGLPSDNTQPPFANSLFQFKLEPDVVLVQCLSDGDNVTMRGWCQDSEGWFIDNICFKYKIDSDSAGFYTLDGEGVDFKTAPPEKRWWGTVFLQMPYLFDVMACSNITYINHKAPERLNKSRAKKKKCPLFEYKTLDIAIPNKGDRAKGGESDRASPRLHLRRGHIRRLSSGNIWVSAAIVGDKSRGVVHKDYRVE